MEKAYEAALAKAQLAKEALERRRMSNLASSNYKDDFQQARNVPAIRDKAPRPSLPSEARKQMHADLQKIEQAKVFLLFDVLKNNLFLILCKVCFREFDNVCIPLQYMSL